MSRAVVDLTRRQVLAFRAERHGLTARRDPRQLSAAASAAGIRRTKMSGLAFAARIRGATGDAVDRAQDAQGLVAVFGPRGTVTIVPSKDVSVFTLGVLAGDEESLRLVLKPFIGQLDAAGISASDALHIVMDAIRAALADGPMHRGAVATAVTASVPPALSPPCRGRCPDPHVEELLFRIAGVAGAMCFGGSSEDLVRVDAHLDAAVPSREDARRALVRRYLRCYGPSSAAALAAWAGISPTDARRSLTDLGDDAIEATIDGRKAGVLLAADIDHVRAAETVDGVRFLAPYDAYLLDRDRTTLIPERAAQRLVWRAAGNPGVALVDGEPAATWRTNQERGRIALKVEPFAPFRTGRPGVDEEAQLVATAVGRTDPVHVVVGAG